jgi:type I restriction enzyme S subunit
VGKFDEVVEIRGGTTPSTQNSDFWDWDISWTSPKDLSNSKSMFLLQTECKITIEWLKQIGSWLLPIWTLLLSSRAPIWYLSLTNIDVAINQGYIAFLEWNIFSNRFMYLWLKSNMQSVINASNGSTFLEISKSSFRLIDCVIPQRNILIEFDWVIKPIFEKILSNLLQIQSLSRTRDELLARLMNGEVKVEV